MSVLHPTSSRRHPIHTVHRISSGAIGLFLLTFGVLGLTSRLPFRSEHGAIIMGLSSNGLLAFISVLAALVLIAAAVRGGPTASTVGIVLGTLFLISGLANLFVLGSGMNMLAFTLSNVVFSVVVGTILLFFGSYGRITGHLPPDSPYYHEAPRPVPAQRKTESERASESMIDQELAEAERAVAQHYATADQQAGVQRAARFRTAEDRRRAWLGTPEESA